MAVPITLNAKTSLNPNQLAESAPTVVR